MRVVDSILELIGGTPMLRLHNVTEGINANVLVKLEYLNPSGSIKDRIALRMIEDAEKAGIIKPGLTTIVEASSGNTAIALSLVGGVKGYKVKIYYPQDVWRNEKIKAMNRYGAEFEMTMIAPPPGAGNGGVHGDIVERPGRVKCKELEESDPNIWWARQFSNSSNVKAHNETGREILEQTDGEVDVFVAAVGTTGTLLGVSEALKEKMPNVKIIAVEPTGWKAAAGEGFLSAWKREIKKVIPGITGGIQLRAVEAGIVDEIVHVGNEDARNMAYRLSIQEGLFCGMSSGANVFVALREARKLGKGRNVVTVLPDSGDRYFSDERFIT